MNRTEPDITSISEKEFNERTRPKPPQLVNPIFARIQKILNYKKQVILYGPPGTGKTWVANNFIQSQNTPEISVIKTNTDKKFFWFTTKLAIFTDLEEFLENKDESEIWYGQEPRAYEEISEGDIVIIYVAGRGGRLYGIATCSRKEVYDDGTPNVLIRAIKPVQGPEWRTISEDPILKNSKPVRKKAMGTLFSLTPQEGLRLLDLAQVSLDDLDISVEEEIEKISPCNFVTFHPSYAYEEFIEGLRPNSDDGGDIRYEIQEGIFKRAAREGLNALLQAAEIDKIWQDQFPVPTFSPEEREKIKGVVDKVPCYLLIDEINRGDISRIFGELITLVEADKRLFCENEMLCILPYSKMVFGIPPNLFIIGTMNTADRSISLMDIALRRRFGFIELLPDYDALKKILITDSNLSEDVKSYRNLAIQSLEKMNERLTEIYDRDHQIGHSYLVKLLQDTSVEDTKETLTNIWKYEIIPLLQEYFYDSPQKLLYITNNRFFEQKGSSFGLKSEDDIIAALQAVKIQNNQV